MPKEFFKDFPTTDDLDGEIFGGRGTFNKVSGILRRDDPTIEDLANANIAYVVFDLPNYPGTFAERYERLKEIVKDSQFLKLAPIRPVVDEEQVFKDLFEMEKAGGEGLMLRDLKSPYESGKRSKYLLKVKTFVDADAIVLDHEPGTGRLSNTMGSLVVKALKNQYKIQEGTIFKIGTGFSDEMRDNPPKIGSVVIYAFNQSDDSTKPRFPVFRGIRADM
jgi:DNA ligase-1